MPKCRLSAGRIVQVLGQLNEGTTAMKYLCLVYFEPRALSGLSTEEQTALDRESRAYDAELARRGLFIAASALQGAATASTIRRRSGKCVITDGPFAETKEVL